MHQNHFFFALSIIIFASSLFAMAEESKVISRDARLFPFQIVRFQNEACRVRGNRNGTCYTASECSEKGGSNSGACAGGFGVCCVFVIGCGGLSRENCTYIQSSNPGPGECRHTICPCNDNVCQLRLDFDSFVITGPSTQTTTDEMILAGNIVANNGVANSLASRCLTDTFSVTNSAGTNPAPICGINTGQHMYVDVDRSPTGEGCNTLDFQLGRAAIGTTLANRQWNIKVTQIDCDSPLRAPAGCTQYFLQSTDVVQTYNYDNGQHLAFQRQTICVRRNQGQCRICWSTINPEDFAVSGENQVNSASMGNGIIQATICCGYNGVGENTKGFDCLQIPGAMESGGRTPLVNSRICGRSVGLVTMSTPDAAGQSGDRTICSTQQPFLIQFISDGFEQVATEIQEPNRGFRLLYMQDNENCPP